MALKTSIIHCLLDPEPHGFHAKSDGSGAAAVNLGFECPTDIARTDLAGKNDAAEANRQSLEDDEHAAQARFSDFAGAVQTVRFHLFEVQPDALDANKCQLDHKGEIAKISDAAAPGAAADMMAWLGKAADTAPFYWTTFDGTDALGARPSTPKPPRPPIVCGPPNPGMRPSPTGSASPISFCPRAWTAA